VTPYSCSYFDRYADPNTGDWIYTAAKTWRPFSSVAPFGKVGVIVSGNGTPEQWAYATTDDRFLQDNDDAGQFPTATVLGLMFDPHQRLRTEGRRRVDLNQSQVQCGLIPGTTRRHHRPWACRGRYPNAGGTGC
jgi:hypothetical protein